VAPVYGEQRRVKDTSALFNLQEAETLVELLHTLVCEQQQQQQQQKQVAQSTKTDVQFARQVKSSRGSMDQKIRNPSDGEISIVRIEDIGVVCMSRAQAVCVRNLLREREMGGVNVGTVDDFQGQEKRVIFISTVLTRLVRS
jgi:hypothetical protein